MKQATNGDQKQMLYRNYDGPHTMKDRKQQENVLQTLYSRGNAKNSKEYSL